MDTICFSFFCAAGTVSSFIYSGFVQLCLLPLRYVMGLGMVESLPGPKELFWIVLALLETLAL